MEAAIEQACNPAVLAAASPAQSSVSTLSLQQSRQVLGVLEEAFAALMYHLQQVRRWIRKAFWTTRQMEWPQIHPLG